MAAAAVANSNGPAAVPPVMQAAADARATGAKQRTSRTSIPTQSGKWILGKTIGAGSMGKVKLARKEDGTEQVSLLSLFSSPSSSLFLIEPVSGSSPFASHRPLTCLWCFFFYSQSRLRLPARSFRAALPKMAIILGQRKKEQISPRKYALRARQPLSPSCNTLIFAGYEMLFGLIIIGTCSSSM